MLYLSINSKPFMLPYETTPHSQLYKPYKNLKYFVTKYISNILFLKTFSTEDVFVKQIDI